MIQYELLSLCRRTCKRFRVYLLDYIPKYEIENRVSHNPGIHRNKISIENMHKETERAQGELGLIDIVKTLVADSSFWNRFVRATNVLCKFESCIDNLRRQFSNMLCEFFRLLVVAKCDLDLMIQCWIGHSFSSSIERLTEIAKRLSASASSRICPIFALSNQVTIP